MLKILNQTMIWLIHKQMGIFKSWAMMNKMKNKHQWEKPKEESKTHNQERIAKKYRNLWIRILYLIIKVKHFQKKLQDSQLLDILKMLLCKKLFII